MANIFKTDMYRILFKYAPDKIPKGYITDWMVWFISPVLGADCLTKFSPAEYHYIL